MDRSEAHRRNTEDVADPTSKPFDLDESSPQPEPDLDLVWREEIEDVMALADRALAQPVPDLSPEEPDRRFLAAGSPVRAPLVETEETSPTNISRQDGFVPARPKELASILRAEAQRIVRVDVETVVDLPTDEKPVRIVYEFDRPVYEAKGVHGTLYTVASGGYRIPFQTGVGAKRIVQIIKPGEYPRQPKQATRTLNLRVEAGQARWSFPDNQ